MKEENKKEFSLKPAESNLLIYVKNHQEAIFSGLISTIAMDRLAYKVTENTKFTLSEDFSKMTVEEIEKSKEESPVVASGEEKTSKPKN